MRNNNLIYNSYRKKYKANFYINKKGKIWMNSVYKIQKERNNNKSTNH